MASSSGQLSRTIENTTFTSEKIDAFNGKSARLLNFEMSIDKLDPKERESIHAMMVISVEISDDVDRVYGVVPDRIVSLKKDSKNSGAGMSEKGDAKTNTTLQIQS